MERRSLTPGSADPKRVESRIALTPDSSGGTPLGRWWHVTVGLCSLAASVLASLVWSTDLVEESWSALVEQLTLVLALAGLATAAWLAISALRRHQTVPALLVGVPALVGVVQPATLLLGTLVQMIEVFLFAD